MIDDKNKNTQNDSSTGNQGSTGNQQAPNQTQAEKPIDVSASSTKDTKDNFSASATKPETTLNVESVKETAQGLIGQAKSTAGQAYGVAAEKAATKLEEKKTDLASGLTSVADTIRQVGSTLRETDEQTGITDTAAKYTETFAGQVEQISKYFERSDVKTMVRDVEGYARRNPAIFIGGAFAAGILLARFLKSSNPSNNSSYKSGRKALNRSNESDKSSFDNKTAAGGKSAVNPS